MPELPDVEAYLFALRERLPGKVLEEVRVGGSFFLRTVAPKLESANGRRVVELRRVGKRVAIGLEGGVWLVIHLMIAGRLHWKARGGKLGGRNLLASFDFEDGSLTVTEAGSKRRLRCMWCRERKGWQARSGWDGSDGMWAGGVSLRVDGRESDFETGADRSASLEWSGKCLLG